MLPASFDGADVVLNPPAGVDLDDCTCLAVQRRKLDNGTPVVISCWKVTADELAEIQRTGRVWLVVMGETMPPVLMAGRRPFEE